MITREQARQIALEHLPVLWSGDIDTALVLIDEATIEKDWGWVFYYTTRKYLETRDINFSIIGGGPFIVERESGLILGLGTAYDVEHYIKCYEKYGDPHFQPGQRICLISCPPDVDRSAAIKLLRDFSGIGLLNARQQIDDCLAGAKPCITTPDPAAADDLATKLESLRFVVKRLPWSSESSATPLLDVRG